MATHIKPTVNGLRLLCRQHIFFHENKFSDYSTLFQFQCRSLYINTTVPPLIVHDHYQASDNIFINHAGKRKKLFYTCNKFYNSHSVLKCLPPTNKQKCLLEINKYHNRSIYKFKSISMNLLEPQFFSSFYSFNISRNYHSLSTKNSDDGFSGLSRHHQLNCKYKCL